MCDFEKQGSHFIITIKTGFCVEFVKKCIYCGLSNTEVYVKDIIIRYNWLQYHVRSKKSSGNLGILTSIFILYQHCPVLAMKYLFLNTQQGCIQNSRRSSLLIRHACRLFEKWMSNFFLCLLEQKTLEAKIFIDKANECNCNLLVSLNNQYYTLPFINKYPP